MGRIGFQAACSSALDPGSTAFTVVADTGAVAEATTDAVVLLAVDLPVEAGLPAAELLGAGRLAVVSMAVAVPAPAVALMVEVDSTAAEGMAAVGTGN